tara:strand:+ start:430 stop:711 length:282 start_codon:yes stop_codon:yes gene_type:complete
MICQRNVICYNTNSRGEKHKSIRKSIIAERRQQDTTLRKSFGAISREERKRFNNIWETHKEFFGNNKEEESSSPEVIINKDDIEEINSFFESD